MWLGALRWSNGVSLLRGVSLNDVSNGVSLFGVSLFGISLFGVSLFGVSLFGVSLFDGAAIKAQRVSGRSGKSGIGDASVGAIGSSGLLVVATAMGSRVVKGSMIISGAAIVLVVGITLPDTGGGTTL